MNKSTRRIPYAAAFFGGGLPGALLVGGLVLFSLGMPPLPALAAGFITGFVVAVAVMRSL